MSKTRAYRSKIGQLPFAFRCELNNRIRDGRQGTDLLDFINASPEFKKLSRQIKCNPVNAQNLSDWRDTGYHSWLIDQDKAAHIREMSEYARTIVSEAGGNPASVGAALLTDKLLTILAEDELPTEALIKAVVSLKKEETAAQKLKLAQSQLSLKEQELALSRERFEVQTAELFLKWFQDKKAVAIATSNSTHDKKIKALRSFIRQAVAEE
jgi:hypothetical protein